jgi:hypothetical protein
MNRQLVSLALVLSVLSAAWAAEGVAGGAAGGPPPETIKLTIHPSPATRPALKYQLLPPVSEQSPGDAVPMYLTGCRFVPEGNEGNELLDRMTDMLDVPLANLRVAEAEEVLGRFKNAMTLFDLAARREYAHWDVGIRERGFDTLLPHLNGIRVVTNAYALRARLAMAKGDWPAAERAIQTALGLARHLNDQPVIVQSLVQAAMIDATLARGVRTWIARPGSPNLYWALTGLPQPMIELRPIAQWERASLEFTIPEFRQALDGTLPPERWGPALRRLTAYLPENVQRGNVDAAAGRFVAAALPAAKEYLVGSGLARAAVDAMPPEQAAGTYMLHRYRVYSDEIWKVWELPYWQAADEMARTEQEVMRETNDGAVNPFLLIVPQISRARYQLARADRHVALLRTIEAVRDHAARTGALPKALEEITAVPLPLDPLTNKPFDYTLAGQTATLVAPSPAGRAQTSGWRFELTLAR